VIRIDDIAGDECEHLTMLVVDAEDARRAVKALVLEVPQERVRSLRPRAGGPPDGVAHSRNRGVGVAPHESLLVQ